MACAYALISFNQGKYKSLWTPSWTPNTEPVLKACLTQWDNFLKIYGTFYMHTSLDVII